MSIHRSLRTLSITALCAFSLTSCSASDSDEEIATVQQDIAAGGFGTVPAFPSAETVMVSRLPGNLDLFRTVSSNVIFNHFNEFTGWTPDNNLGKPSGVNLASLAVTANGGGLFLFAAATTGAVYLKVGSNGDNPTWSSWTLMNGVTARDPGEDAITASSWSPGRVDLFWVTPARNVGHAWFASGAWQGVETGDNGGPTYLRPPSGVVLAPPIESVSTRPNRLDIVVGGVGPKSHHRWDGTLSGWENPEALACCQVGTLVPFSLHDFVLLKASDTSFELFGLTRHGVPADTEVWRFTHTITGRWPKTASGKMSPTDAVTTNPGGASGIGDPNQTVRLNQGLRWNNLTRRDLVGWMATVGSGNLMWQMFIP